MSEIILQVWTSSSGQYAGRILNDGNEEGRVCGCDSIEDIECQAIEAGLSFDRVEELDHMPPVISGEFKDLPAVDYKTRMEAIAKKMNSAINAGKIRELRKVGEDCHSAAFQILQEVNTAPKSSKSLKKAALDLFIAVRMGSIIDVDFNNLN